MNCRVCRSNDLGLFYVQGDNDQYRYYKCAGCGLVNLDLGTVAITQGQQKYADRFKPPVDYAKAHGARDALRFVSRYVQGKGRYLDIGCGYGQVLYFFKQAGWNVRGLELSPIVAAHVQAALAVDVDVANFLDYDPQGRTYELVSLRHVLEHLPEPVRAMEKIARLLVPKGHAHFEFPNIDGLSHRAQRLWGRLGLHRRKYAPDYVPGHCSEFSRGAFEGLLRQTGFRLVRWETYSFRRVSNFVYNRIPVGTKARALVQKQDQGR